MVHTNTKVGCTLWLLEDDTEIQNEEFVFVHNILIIIILILRHIDLFVRGDRTQQ
jgi:hypothetical protein